MNDRLTLTLKLAPRHDGAETFEVYRGATFLARVSFEGPYGLIRIHEGALYYYERKAVYQLYKIRRSKEVSK